MKGKGETGSEGVHDKRCAKFTNCPPKQNKFAVFLKSRNLITLLQKKNLILPLRIPRLQILRTQLKIHVGFIGTEENGHKPLIPLDHQVNNLCISRPSLRPHP